MAEQERNTGGTKKSNGKPISLHLASSTMDKAFAADQFVGDDTLPSVYDAELTPGSRIEIIAKPIGLTLTCPTGVIVGPSDDWEGYYTVHLDEPAVYHHPDGHNEPVEEIIEAPDNFAVLAPQQ